MRLLGSRPYATFWAGQTLSYLGDMVSTAALMLLLYQATRSVAAVGILLGARALPNLLFGLHAGAMVDRVDRKLAMVAADLARAGLVAVIPLLLLAHAVTPWIYPVAFLLSTATVIFNPARSALMPDLVEDADLLSANAFLTSSERLMEVLGYALGGLLIAASGYSLPFYLDAVTFLVSALLLGSMSFPAGGRSTSSRRELVWRDVAAGLRIASDSPGLRATLGLGFLAVLPGGLTLPILVFLARDTLNAGPTGYVGLEVSIAVGLALGAALLSLARGVATGKVMALGLGLTGLFFVLAGMSRSYALTALWLGLAHVFQVMYLISNVTALQRLAGDGLRGRIFGLRQALVQTGLMLGMLLAGTVGALVNPASVYVGAGMALVLLGLGAISVPTLRRVP